MKGHSLLFCLAALLTSLAIAAIAFPFAAMAPEELAAAENPVPADEMPPVDLGEFGVVPVSDLVAYYIENPPVEDTGTAALPDRTRHFGGC
jgi:hypothetical protein